MEKLRFNLDIKKNKDFGLKYLDMNTNLEFRDELLFDENGVVMIAEPAEETQKTNMNH